MFNFLKPHNKEYHATEDNGWIWGVLWAILMFLAVLLVARVG